MAESKSKEKYQNKFIDIWGYLPRIKTAIDSGMNIMLRGKTGTGKTYLIGELAKEYGKTLLVTNMTSGVGIEEIKGRYVVQPDEDGKTTVKWIDGILVTAMKKGYWLVIEEANFMPEELASIFYSVMDDRRNIILDEHKNEVVKAHPNFRLFLTANWGYKGTVIPNDAIRNRIDVYFDLAYLNTNEESKLVARETGVDEEIAKQISKFAWSQRNTKSRHQPDISTRILIRWASLITNGLSPMEAGEHTIVSLLFHDEKEKEKIRETMKIYFEDLEFEARDKKSKKRRKKRKKRKAKDKKGDVIEVGDLVSMEKDSKKYYAIVNKIMTSRSGKKAWGYWNEDKPKAKKKIATDLFPMESAELVSKIKLEEKGVDS